LQTITHNPREIYSATSDYAHALEVQGTARILYVSGTMGLNEDGAPGSSLAHQLDLIWRNLRKILASAGMSVDNVVRVTSYLRDRAYAEENAAARVAALKGRPVPTTAIVVETLERDWLVELEIIAAA